MNSSTPEVIPAKVEHPVKIMLNSRSTAGYDWQPEFDTTHVKLIKRDRIVKGKALGASSKVVFNFQPLIKGDLKIVFLLLRPWEDQPIEEKQYLLHVV